MTYEQFADLADRLWDEIPERFKLGLHGVHVLERVQPDPDEPELLRLGEYFDPGPPSVLGGFEGIGRHIALYYGSFAEIAWGDPGFDWEGEIWETLIHELQHHLESLAGWNNLILDDLERLRKYRDRG
ncbi:MAG: metallopeptidase family protein [Meiothermus sp.]|nr:metallopeptidase family protein [Meiothermus sp.]